MKRRSILTCSNKMFYQIFEYIIIINEKSGLLYFVSGKQFAGKTKNGFAHKLPERNRQTRDRKDVCDFFLLLF